MRYFEVIEFIEQQIKDQVLSAGSKLPSIRILAEELGCSKSTVLKAYETLVQGKLAYPIEKTGYYLMNNPEDILLSKKVNFHSLYLEPSLIQNNDIQILFNRMMNHYHRLEDDVQGVFDLREALKRFFKSRKIFTNVHDLMISASKQEALNTLLRLFPEGKVLVENPLDVACKNVFEGHKRVVYFNRIDEGLDLSLLEYYFIKDDIKAIYVTPYFHLPTGRDLSLKEKMDLLDLCYKHEVYIIENNMFEETYDYILEQSLYALDKYDIVFHLKTFEHVYHRILKLAVIVVPHDKSKHLVSIKRVLYGPTSEIEQMILGELLRHADLELARQELRISLQKKFDLLKKHLVLPEDYEVHYFENQMGCFVQVPSHFNVEMLALELADHNVIIENCNHFFVGGHLFKGILLSLAVANMNQTVETAQLITEYFT